MIEFEQAAKALARADFTRGSADPVCCCRKTISPVAPLWRVPNPTVFETLLRPTAILGRVFIPIGGRI